MKIETLAGISEMHLIHLLKERSNVNLCGVELQATGFILKKFLIIASVSLMMLIFSTEYIFFLGVNCTQSDLEAIISGNDDVELLDLDTEKLYYEIEYK